MNIRVQMEDGSVEHVLYPNDDTDSYYSSRVPFSAERLAASTRTKPVTRQMLAAHCVGRREADERTDDLELKRDIDSREVDDAGIVPADGELFVMTRIVAREAER